MAYSSICYRSEALTKVLFSFYSSTKTEAKMLVYTSRFLLCCKSEALAILGDLVQFGDQIRDWFSVQEYNSLEGRKLKGFSLASVTEFKTESSTSVLGVR
ncbi:hypothetical protein Tco_1547262 [Tanacetum coccineum]